MAAQAKVSMINKGNTIVNTCWTCDLAEEVTPTGYPLKISFLSFKVKVQRPMDPTRQGQGQRMHNKDLPFINSSSLMRLTAVGILEQSSAIEKETN
jgi:hypothetical protein